LGAVTTISTDEAEELLDEGITFIDVRTVEEFDDGHLRGSFNVPVSIDTEQGRVANPDFLDVMEVNFEKSEKMVILCRAGARSARAVTILREAGYSELLDMTAGVAGGKDPFGEVIMGWQTEGRELLSDSDESQRYCTLSRNR
jgi:rhodanese-related sulfurtransferase